MKKMENRNEWTREDLKQATLAVKKISRLLRHPDELEAARAERRATGRPTTATTARQRTKPAKVGGHTPRDFAKQTDDILSRLLDGSLSFPVVNSACGAFRVMLRIVALEIKAGGPIQLV